MDHLTPSRRHRHRRLAAILGDFDAAGFAAMAVSHPPDHEFDKAFLFGPDDFEKKPDSFLFPNAPALALALVLHLPIKLAANPSHRRLRLSSLGYRPRFGEALSTTPKLGVIDLDEILRVEASGVPPAPPPADDFLASPFLRTSASVSALPSLPLASRADAIVEEEDDDDHHEVCIDDAALDDYYLPPPGADVYTHNLAASLATLLAKHVIHAPVWLANLSRDLMKTTQLPPPIVLHHRRRSGAMATRYQVFYDQLNRISNALRNSSSDLIHLVRTNSQSLGPVAPLMAALMAPKDRFLGHLALLPLLKLGLVQPQTQPQVRVPRFVELRRHSPPIITQNHRLPASVAVVRPFKNYSSSPVLVHLDNTGEVISNLATDITEYDPPTPKGEPKGISVMQKTIEPPRTHIAAPQIVVSSLSALSSSLTDDTFDAIESKLLPAPPTLVSPVTSSQVAPPPSPPLTPPRPISHLYSSPAASTFTIDIPRRKPTASAASRQVKSQLMNLELLPGFIRPKENEKKKKRKSKFLLWLRKSTSSAGE